jgi:hypothetical protein
MSEVPTRLVRDALRDQAAAASPTCFDAETLGAWADGALNARERDAVESHAADCARCQAMLAAMAKSAPPPPARAWWRMPALGWIVPLTAAASAVLWFGTMEIRHAPTGPKAAASPQPAAQEAQTSLERRLDAPLSQPAASPPPPARARELASRATAPKVAGPAGAERPTPARTAPSGQAPTPLSDVAERRDTVARQEQTPIPAETRAEADARRTPASPSPSPPPASAPASGNATAAAAPPPRPEAFRAAESVMMKSSIAAPQPIVVSAPGAATRWRLLPGGIVERSTDGGATWQEQSTGVAVALTNGSATSSTTCWLVGPAGIVLLTTDGRTWHRVSIPEAIDVFSVRATDERSATVFAAGGRTFTTTDGGKTWK